MKWNEIISALRILCISTWVPLWLLVQVERSSLFYTDPIFVCLHCRATFLLCLRSYGTTFAYLLLVYLLIGWAFVGFLVECLWDMHRPVSDRWKSSDPGSPAGWPHELSQVRLSRSVLICRVGFWFVDPPRVLRERVNSMRWSGICRAQPGVCHTERVCCHDGPSGLLPWCSNHPRTIHSRT